MPRYYRQPIDRRLGGTSGGTCERKYPEENNGEIGGSFGVGPTVEGGDIALGGGEGAPDLAENTGAGVEREASGNSANYDCFFWGKRREEHQKKERRSEKNSAVHRGAGVGMDPA